MKIVIYLACAAAVLLLCALSSKESAGEDLPRWRAFVRRGAAAVVRWRQLRGGFAGQEGVRLDLEALDASPGAARRLQSYYTDKVELLLWGVLLGSLLCAGLTLTATGSGAFAGGVLVRSPVSGQERRVQLQAVGESDSGEQTDLGEYTLDLAPRQYSRRELRALLPKAERALKREILGKNKKLSAVRSSLSLVRSLSGYPFSISWESSDASRVEESGRVHNGSLRAGESRRVTLTALFVCGSFSSRVEIPVTVRPPRRTKRQQQELSVRRALRQADRESRTKGKVSLPESAGGLRLQWSEKKSEQSLQVFVFVLAVLAISFFAADSHLRDRRKKREREMALDYPALVMRLVLYLGAGMSVRSAFAAIAADYAGQRARGGRRRALQEEVLQLCHELEGGVSEAKAYENFARRCGSGRYLRLGTILTRNLRRGSDLLLTHLREEAQKAGEERRDMARVMGEEAGTRLLLPMMIMLGVTMALIVVPAYLSFSV